MVLRLLRGVNRRVGDTTYYRWRIDLPDALIAELGWPEGVELAATVRGNRLQLEPIAE